MLSQDWVGPLPLLAACEAGKAVYTSAALEIDPGLAREVKERVQTSGVAFMAELPRRHAAATLRLKELIATKLGQPRLLFCHERKLLDQASNSPPRGPHCPANIRHMMELVDWCRYVVGREPTSVVGVWHHAVAGSTVEEDYQMMSLDFSSGGSAGSGPVAQISCGRYIPKSWHEAISFRPPASLQVCCEHGVAFIDLPNTLTWFHEAGQHLESLDNERPVGEQMLMQFHRAVTSLVRKTSDLEDAYRALHVVLASQTSSIEGRRIPLEF
jgi:predicted dehydrogenase